MATTHPTHPVPRTAATRPAPRAANLAGLVVNLVLLYLLEVRPGWRAVPFLSAEAGQVVPLVAAALWTGVAVEALAVLVHTGWFRALGDLATSVVGLVATLRVWDVFPFDLPAGWSVPVRVVLVLAVVGGVVGIVSALSRLLEGITPRPRG